MPSAPRKDFPLIGNSEDVRCATSHLCDLVAEQGLHNLGLRKEQQPRLRFARQTQAGPPAPDLPHRTAVQINMEMDREPNA